MEDIGLKAPKTSRTSCGPVGFDAPVVERGVGFFETLLLVGRRAVLWEPHLERLLGTLRRFRLPAPAPDEIEAEAVAAVSASPSAGERALRLSWIAIGPDLERCDAWRLDASVRAIPELTLRRRAGSHAFTLPADLSRDTPGVKSTSYFAAIVGLRLAREHGADEGLFTDSDGTYREGTSTALVAWRGREPLVPREHFLPSVTAAAFLQGRGLPSALTRGTVRAGALLLGSLTKAAPVVALDGEPCEPPRELLDAARAFNEQLVGDAALGHLL